MRIFRRLAVSTRNGIVVNAPFPAIECGALLCEVEETPGPVPPEPREGCLLVSFTADAGGAWSSDSGTGSVQPPEFAGLSSINVTSSTNSRIVINATQPLHADGTPTLELYSEDGELVASGDLVISGDMYQRAFPPGTIRPNTTYYFYACGFTDEPIPEDAEVVNLEIAGGACEVSSHEDIGMLYVQTQGGPSRLRLTAHDGPTTAYNDLEPGEHEFYNSDLRAMWPDGTWPDGPITIDVVDANDIPLVVLPDSVCTAINIVPSVFCMDFTFEADEEGQWLYDPLTDTVTPPKAADGIESGVGRTSLSFGSLRIYMQNGLRGAGTVIATLYDDTNEELRSDALNPSGDEYQLFWESLTLTPGASYRLELCEVMFSPEQ